MPNRLEGVLNLLVPQKPSHTLVTLEMKIELIRPVLPISSEPGPFAGTSSYVLTLMRPYGELFVTAWQLVPCRSSTYSAELDRMILRSGSFPKLLLYASAGSWSRRAVT